MKLLKSRALSLFVFLGIALSYPISLWLKRSQAVMPLAAMPALPIPTSTAIDLAAAARNEILAKVSKTLRESAPEVSASSNQTSTRDLDNEVAAEKIEWQAKLSLTEQKAKEIHGLNQEIERLAIAANAAERLALAHSRLLHSAEEAKVLDAELQIAYAELMKKYEKSL